MATKAGAARDEAYAALLGDLVDHLDAQLRTLIDEGVQQGAQAADRLARAARTLVLSRKAAVAAEEAAARQPTHSTPPNPEGDDDEDEIEPPRDDAEGEALRAQIIRGLHRLKAGGDLEPDASSPGTEGPESDGEPRLLRAPPLPDTS